MRCGGLERSLARDRAHRAERAGAVSFHGMFNAYWEPLTFELPATAAADGSRWRCCLDTAAASPGDIVPWASAPLVAGSSRLVEARSIVLLAQAVPPGSRGADVESAV